MATEFKLCALLKQVFPDVDFENLPDIEDQAFKELTLKEADRILGLPDGEDIFMAFAEELSNSNESDFVKQFSSLNSKAFPWLTCEIVLLVGLIRHFMPRLELLDEGLKDDQDSVYPDLTVNNTALMEWLHKTPYRHVSAYMVRVMYYEMLHWSMEYNPPMQDYLAMQCSDVEPSDPELYISKVLDVLKVADDHFDRGLKLGLNEDLMALTDMLWEFIPHDYPDEYVQMACEMYKIIQQQLPRDNKFNDQDSYDLFEHAVMDKCFSLAAEREIELSNFSLNYIHFWLENKYFVEETDEDSPSNTLQS